MLNEIMKEIHANAVAHGWWEEEKSFPEIIALVHSELSEALEEDRNGRPFVYYNCDGAAGKPPCLDYVPVDGVGCGRRAFDPDKFVACSNLNPKPEGVAIELADAIIRILDYCGHAGIDIDEAIRIKHEFNKRRPYKHGGKDY